MDDYKDYLTEKFRDHLKGFISKRIAPPADAEDVLQEVYYRTYRHFDKLNQTGNVHAWAYRIARNTINDYYRTRRIAEPLDGIPDQEISGDEENDNKEIAGCLRAMVDHLPAKDREAIMLTEYQGLTQKEMAELLGLSISGAKSRVQRAKKKLRKMLCGCCKLELDRHGNIIEYKLKAKTNPFCDLK